MKILMNKFLSNDEIKTAVIQTFKHYYYYTDKRISFPVPIKAIAKSYTNIRVVPYSTQIKKFNLSYQEMIEHSGTKDAYTDFDANNNLYIIYYNDMDNSKMSSNRYRWNIAHELGHVQLQHHIKFDNAKLCRNELSNSDYKELEIEADMFASYILAPYLPLLFKNIKSQKELQQLCKISGPAAGYRYQDYIRWQNNPKNNSIQKNKYEYALWKLFFGTFECKNCKSVCIPERRQIYCHICGEKPIYFSGKESEMIYSAVKLDDNLKPFKCPICDNEQLVLDGDYCQICGTYLFNECTHQNYDIDCKSGHLDGDARYCPYCGSVTTYLRNGILKEYNAPDDMEDYNYDF